MKKRVLSLVLALVLISQSALAHSGRTDGSGGHRDKNNVSGLGSYHYHCGGNPAHLHPNGVCPFAGGGSYSSSGGLSSSYSSGSSGIVNHSGSGVSVSVGGGSNNGSLSVGASKSSAVPRTLSFNGTNHTVNTLLIGGVSMMEVRSFAEAMGFVLELDNGAIRITGKDSKSLALYPNSTKVRRWNGYMSNTSDDLISPVKTQVIGGRTYVPARFLVESLGYSISFDGSTYVVSGGSVAADSGAFVNSLSGGANSSTRFALISHKYGDKFANIEVFLDEYGVSYVDAVNLSNLLGLTYSISQYNGYYDILIDNYDLVGKKSSISSAVVFAEGMDKFLYSWAGGEGVWEISTSNSFFSRGSFFVPAADIYFALRINGHYEGSTMVLDYLK